MVKPGLELNLPQRVSSEELMTKPEVAKRMKVHVNSVDNFIKRDGLPVIRLGKSVRFRWSAVCQWLAARETASAPK